MRKIANIVESLKSGETTSLELVKEALARATDSSGEGALVFTEIYANQAIVAAQVSDDLRAAGIVLSPLAGIPISIKDLFDVCGETTKAGSVALSDMPVLEQESIVVRRLREAGAILIGRTNMTEFAYSGLGLNPHYGTPANQYDRANRRIPGGSSSGAAISVTDGMAAGAIGTDTGGSTRIPAALCGLVGFKPTQNRTLLSGAFPLSQSLDTVGPIAPSVSCCALLDAVLSGETELPKLLPRAPQTLTFGVFDTYLVDDIDDDVAHAFETACKSLEKAGARLVRFPFTDLMQIPDIALAGCLVAAESYAIHKPYEVSFGSYDPRVIERILAGKTIFAHEYLDILRIRSELVARFGKLAAGLDGFLAPTTPRTAPRIATLENDISAYQEMNRLMLRNTSVFNFLDACAISVPCHEPDRAPVGLMIAAPSSFDRTLLSAALSIEAILAHK